MHYWEYAKRMQAVRMGRWKAVRQHPDKPIEVFDLESDEGERTDVAAKNLATASQLAGIMNSAHAKSSLYPLAGEK